MEGSASPSCPQRHGCSTAAMTLKPAASAPRSSPPGSGEEQDRYTTVRSNTRDDATDAEVLEVVTLPAQVKHGRRQRVMLCSGEPGIGKSSLLRRFVHAAGRRRTAFSRPTALVRMMAVNSQPMADGSTSTPSHSQRSRTCANRSGVRSRRRSRTADLQRTSELVSAPRRTAGTRPISASHREPSAIL